MGAIARGLHQPVHQLPVAVGKRAEVPKGHKALLHVLDPDSTRPFFWGSAGGQAEIKNP